MQTKRISGNTPSRACACPSTEVTPRGLGYTRGGQLGNEPQYTIDKISPTKRKGSIVAHAIVRFGPAWVRYRIVNTDRGLCVFPPANPCPGPGGRTFYRSSAGVDDDGIRDRLREDIIAAYKHHLATVGRPVPRPLPKCPPIRNRINEAIEAVADEVDPLAAGRQLVRRVNEVLGDPAATDREILAGAKILAQVLDIDTRRLATAVTAMTCETPPVAAPPSCKSRVES
jgi:hypothetical protein